MAAPTRSDYTAAPGIAEHASAPARVMRWAIPPCLFMLALAVRLLPWQTIFQSNGTYPYGNDAYYHLRRIRYAVENFPGFQSFDPFINFPHGAQPIWPPTLDWLVALVIRLGVGTGDPEALERWVVTWPPVLGALTVVFVYFLGRRFYSPTVAVLAAFVLALLPAHFRSSQLGFADHHVVVSMLSVAILWTGMRLFGETPSPLSLTRGFAAAAWLGLAMGATILVWPGALIHVAIVEVAMIGSLFLARERSEGIGRAWRFAITHAVILILVFPMSAGNEWPRWGSFSPLVLSNFQPIYFGSGAILFAACALIWGHWDRCGQQTFRIGVAVLLGAAVATFLFTVIPELRTGALDSWAWVSREEAFQAAVVESAPLFHGRAGATGMRPATLLTYFVFFVPFALVFLAWRDGRRGDQAFFLWWATAFFVASLAQRRFIDTYSIPHVLLMAQAAVWVHHIGARHLGTRGVGVWGMRCALAVGITVLLEPIGSTYSPHLKNLGRASRGEAPQLPERQGMLRDAARWLRENSPAPIDPGYSVLAPWGDGHLLKYIAERPIVQDNFGDDVATENFVLAEQYFSASSEVEALDVLNKTRTRYVLVRDAGSGQKGDYAPTSLQTRLFVMKGSRGEIHRPKRGIRAKVDALHHHRLVYESPRPAGSAPHGPARSFAKIFEIVPGALILGRAQPNAIVNVRLELRSPHGPFVYNAVTEANADGAYELHLPYSNEAFSPEIRVARRYTLTSEDEKAFLTVSEAAVREGMRIEGPSFR